MGILSNKIKRDEIKAGDHIYSWRNSYLYSHHGIYTNEEKVIHFTRGAGQEVGTGTILDQIVPSSSTPSNKSKVPCTVCGDQSDLSGVISSCLDCFLKEGDLYRFEYNVSATFFLAKARGGTCTTAPSDPPEHVLQRAAYLLQNGFGGYNIFKNNCEDFAVYCRTGLLVTSTDYSLGRSGQVSSFIAAMMSSPLRSSFSGLTIVGCGIYCFSRLFSDIGFRRDVMKIPVERLVNPYDFSQVVESIETIAPEELLCELDKPPETSTFKKADPEKLPDSCGLIQPTEGA